MIFVRHADPAAGSAIGRLIALPFSLVAALAACAPAKPPLPVEALLVGDECRVIIDGRSLTIEEISATARQWRRRQLSLKTGTDVPFRCIGSAVFALQRAGAARIGFISEPPPEEPLR